MELSHALEAALAAVREAGDLLREDFLRPGGPRGGGDKAEADLEAEHRIRGRLRAEFPQCSYRGEETGSEQGSHPQPVWLVDPNDGTRDYLLGRRGSAVSIGLLVDGRPVVGVVHSFAYPDGGGDLFAWAEGCGPMRRNGAPLEARLPERLGRQDVVLVSTKGDRDPEGHLRCVAPARYRTLPSIAHRLALVAAGEASAAIGLYAPGDWDYAGGHALLRAAGGSLLNEDGKPVAYAEDGSSKCQRVFAGSEPVAALLGRRALGVDVTDGSGRGPAPVRLRRGEAVADNGLLARAQGCLLGQVAGDSLGSRFEFQDSASIAQIAGDGPRTLEDGGLWNTLAGQPTDDSEMALALARAIVAQGRYLPEAALFAYREWLQSGPFDIGRTTLTALEGRPDQNSQANGSLMRASPLGVLFHAWPTEQAVRLARMDSALTHPHPVCGDAVAAFVVAVGCAIRAGDASAAYAAARRWAEAEAAEPVARALREAATRPPECDRSQEGWTLIALQNAFYELLHAESLEEGVVRTVRRGGDTDTNAAITGALLGAVHGRDGVPAQWRSMVLSCRPQGPGAARPRPAACWPVDVLEIAERLLLAGLATGAVDA